MPSPAPCCRFCSYRAWSHLRCRRGSPASTGIAATVRSWRPIVVVGAAILLWCARLLRRGQRAPWPWIRHVAWSSSGHRFRATRCTSGVLTLVLGWALVLGSPLLLFYVLCLGIGFHLRTVLAEEPYLAAHFGED